MSFSDYSSSDPSYSNFGDLNFTPFEGKESDDVSSKKSYIFLGGDLDSSPQSVAERKELSKLVGNVFTHTIASLLDRLMTRTPLRFLGVQLRTQDALDLMKEDFNSAVSIAQKMRKQMQRDIKDRQKDMRKAQAKLKRERKNLQPQKGIFGRRSESLSEESQARIEQINSEIELLEKNIEAFDVLKKQVKDKLPPPKLGEGNETKKLQTYLENLEQTFNSIDTFSLQLVTDCPSILNDEEELPESFAKIENHSSPEFDELLGLDNHKRYLEASMMDKLEERTASQHHRYLQPAFTLQTLATKDRSLAMQGIASRRFETKSHLKQCAEAHLEKNSTDYAYRTRMELKKLESSEENSGLKLSTKGTLEIEGKDTFSYKTLVSTAKKERRAHSAARKKVDQWLQRISKKPQKIHTPMEQAEFLWKATTDERARFMSDIDESIQDMDEILKKVEDYRKLFMQGLRDPKKPNPEWTQRILNQTTEELSQSIEELKEAKKRAESSGPSYADLKVLKTKHREVIRTLDRAREKYNYVKVPGQVNPKSTKSLFSPDIKLDFSKSLAADSIRLLDTRHKKLTNNPILQKEVFQILTTSQEMVLKGPQEAFKEFDNKINQTCQSLYDDADALQEKEADKYRNAADSILTNRHKIPFEPDELRSPEDIKAFEKAFKKYKSQQEKRMKRLPSLDQRIDTLAEQSKHVRAVLGGVLLRLEEKANKFENEESIPQELDDAITAVRDCASAGTDESLAKAIQAVEDLSEINIEIEDFTYRISRKKKYRAFQFLKELGDKKGGLPQMARLNEVLKKEVFPQAQPEVKKDCLALATEHSELKVRSQNLASETQALRVREGTTQKDIDAASAEKHRIDSARSIAKNGILKIERDFKEKRGHLIFQNSKAIRKFKKNPRSVCGSKKTRDDAQTQIGKTKVYQDTLGFRSRRVKECQKSIQRLDKGFDAYILDLRIKRADAEYSGNKPLSHELTLMIAQARAFKETRDIPKDIHTNNVTVLRVKGRIANYEEKLNQLMENQLQRVETIENAIAIGSEGSDLLFDKLEASQEATAKAQQELDSICAKLRNKAQQLKAQQLKDSDPGLAGDLNNFLNGRSNINYLSEEHQVFLDRPEGRELKNLLLSADSLMARIWEGKKVQKNLQQQLSVIKPNLLRKVESLSVQLGKLQDKNLLKKEKRFEDDPNLVFTLKAIMREIEKVDLPRITFLTQDPITRENFNEAKNLVEEVQSKCNSFLKPQTRENLSDSQKINYALRYRERIQETGSSDDSATLGDKESLKKAHFKLAKEALGDLFPAQGKSIDETLYKPLHNFNKEMEGLYSSFESEELSVSKTIDALKALNHPDFPRRKEVGKALHILNQYKQKKKDLDYNERAILEIGEKISKTRASQKQKLEQIEDSFGTYLRNHFGQDSFSTTELTDHPNRDEIKEIQKQRREVQNALQKFEKIETENVDFEDTEDEEFVLKGRRTASCDTLIKTRAAKIKWINIDKALHETEAFIEEMNKSNSAPMLAFAKRQLIDETAVLLNNLYGELQSFTEQLSLDSVTVDPSFGLPEEKIKLNAREKDQVLNFKKESSDLLNEIINQQRLFTSEEFTSLNNEQLDQFQKNLERDFETFTSIRTRYQTFHYDVNAQRKEFMDLSSKYQAFEQSTWTDYYNAYYDSLSTHADSQEKRATFTSLSSTFDSLEPKRGDSLKTLRSKQAKLTEFISQVDEASKQLEKITVGQKVRKFFGMEPKTQKSLVISDEEGDMSTSYISDFASKPMIFIDEDEDEYFEFSEEHPALLKIPRPMPKGSTFKRGNGVFTVENSLGMLVDDHGHQIHLYQDENGAVLAIEKDPNDDMHLKYIGCSDDDLTEEMNLDLTDEDGDLKLMEINRDGDVYHLFLDEVEEEDDSIKFSLYLYTSEIEDAYAEIIEDENEIQKLLYQNKSLTDSEPKKVNRILSESSSDKGSSSSKEEETIILDFDDDLDNSSDTED